MRGSAPSILPISKQSLYMAGKLTACASRVLPFLNEKAGPWVWVVPEKREYHENDPSSANPRQQIGHTATWLPPALRSHLPVDPQQILLEI